MEDCSASIILHPFSSGRPKDKVETWAYLSSIRQGRIVIDQLIDGRMDYNDFVREYWGRDDLIILEDDKVPGEGDIVELENCKEPACIFPYPVSFYNRTTMKDWTEVFPYGLGFVKFSKATQEAVPARLWYIEGKNWGLDQMLEVPIMKLFGPMHLHKRFIKHNHRPTVAQRVVWGLRGH